MKTKISGNPIATIRLDEAFIDGFSAKNIVKEYDTPVFVYSENKIRMNCSKFLKIFNKYFNNLLVIYSFKANYLPQICDVIKAEGIGAETVTKFELESAIKLNFDPEKIQLGGVYLPDNTLKRALEKKIGLISLCSYNQLSNLGKLSASINGPQTIGLRIISPKYDRRIGLNPTKENIKKFVDLTSKFQNLKLNTLHSHYGTQNMDPSIYRENVKYLIKASNLMEQFGVTIDRLNLGGGFPEASIFTDKQMNEVGQGILDILKESGWEYKKIIFEPGRYIIGDAGILLTRVIDIKTEEEKWIFTDAGTNNCPISSNSNYRFFCANKINQPNESYLNIAGPLPTQMDVIAKKTPFIKNVEIDDIIMVLNVGAYNLSWGTLFPFPQPPFILIKENQLKEIRPRKNPSFVL
ncbi:MAG: diaminopimelate decarboxylase family protein [Candidatus Helarchaeota archaeon]